MQNMKNLDTIAAISTPIGFGGIGVIRISGKLVTSVIIPIILGKLLKPRQAEYISFKDIQGKILDQGIAIFYPSPNSFTGEDVLELQGHGSPMVLDILLQNIVSFSGVRVAHPGEFSERAFLNNKIDLTQAEAIIDLIYSESIQCSRLAIQSVLGSFSSCINKLIKKISTIRTNIEGIINFPEDDVLKYTKHDITNDLQKLIDDFHKIYCEVKIVRVFREGIKIVIAGEPNVGKSSLFNVLTKNDNAIVTACAGTTRDVLCKKIYINGIPLHIMDTAGLCNDISNEINRISLQRSLLAINNADYVLFVVDSQKISLPMTNILKIQFLSHVPKNIPTLIIRNKSDLTNEKPERYNIQNYPCITISTKLNHGIFLIQQYLKEQITSNMCLKNFQGKFLVRKRHVHALHSAKKHLLQIAKYLDNPFSFDELISEELYATQKILSKIIGKFNSNDLIKKVFSTFCIGK
ncbi:MAG: 5-carboxymethylaminomethyluridine-tRNA synthase GTPase subunit [Candidatus Westeberhardia cardiocondylae]|nr:5-carboxymethylaminomethyluridine-tRNA synthase GTPase subunit [Candidatus Westeberhardia cardiocondylae]